MVRQIAPLEKIILPVTNGENAEFGQNSTLRLKHPRSTQRIDSEVIDIPTAPKLDQETRSRKELGALFGVTNETIRIWEESGKLLTLGGERIPLLKSPVKYSRTSQPNVRVSAQE